jgi:hypothetical protein
MKCCCGLGCRVLRRVIWFEICDETLLRRKERSDVSIDGHAPGGGVQESRCVGCIAVAGCSWPIT